MCSICRNPKCIYQFGKEKWGPPDDGIVTIQLPEIPEPTLTFLESVRAYEAAWDSIRTLVKETLALPSGRLK